MYISTHEVSWGSLCLPFHSTILLESLFAFFFAGDPSAPLVNTYQRGNFSSLILMITQPGDSHICVRQYKIYTSYPIHQQVVNKVDPLSDTTITTVNGLVLCKYNYIFSVSAVALDNTMSQLTVHEPVITCMSKLLCNL